MRSRAARLHDLGLRAIALLACLSLLPLAVPPVHAAHGAGGAEKPIFSAARHAGQAEHCEAADTVRLRHCPACLAPARLQALAPNRTSLEHGLGRAAAVAARTTCPRDRQAARSIRPRAPPLF